MRHSDAAKSHNHHQKRVQTRRPTLAAPRHPQFLPDRRSDRVVLALSFTSNTRSTAAVLSQPRKLLEPPPSLPRRPSSLPRRGQPDKWPAKITRVELLETACFPLGPSFPGSCLETRAFPPRSFRGEGWLPTHRDRSRLYFVPFPLKDLLSTDAPPTDHHVGLQICSSRLSGSVRVSISSR
jgi:hypothetical protein